MKIYHFIHKSNEVSHMKKHIEKTTLIRIRTDLRDRIKVNKPSISGFIEKTAITKLQSEGLWE